MENGEFFITLPSNTECPEFPDNTPSSYKIGLPAPLEFEDLNWEVALVELVYPRTWQNIGNKQNDIRYNFIKTDYYAPYEIIKSIPQNNYNSIHDVVAAIETVSRPDGFSGHFTIDKLTGKCILSLYGQEKVKMDMGLARILGFKDNSYKNVHKDMKRHRQIVADYPPNLNANLNVIYIYTNLIQTSLVGNSYVPLLRTVPANLTTDFGNVVVESFFLPHYFPLAARYFTYIEIKLTDHAGQPIQFMTGSVVAKLHIRRRKQLVSRF